MYTDRNIYDQEGHLLFRKNRPGHRADENQNQRIKTLQLFSGPNAQKAYPPAFDDEQKGHPAQMIRTSHIHDLFQLKDENLIERSAQILGNTINSPQNELLRHIMDTIYCLCEWVYTHSVHVALISLMIADRLNIDEKQKETLAAGALLHDVGKLKVPTAILEKDSSLSDKEMALMQKHCEFGIDLLAVYGLPQDVLNVVIQHHERLDASGYPNRLKSNEISRLAKITMIADVIDAVTSHRPYRPARSLDTAVRIVKQEGTKFCSKYVDILDELCRKS